MAEYSGRFITLEGMEGAGKSTNLEYLCALLAQREIPFIVTREPGGTEVAEVIRDVLLTRHAEPTAPMSELLLVFAARAQHLERVIVPALARGEWVVCDRFTDATYAYQGFGRQMGGAQVEQLESLVQGSLRPDLTVVLDVPVELSVERISARAALDRFESEPATFFERVREGYLARVAADSDRYRLIDASQPLADVQRALLGVMEPFIAAAGLGGAKHRE